jgi:hypothetical protein
MHIFYFFIFYIFLLFLGLDPASPAKSLAQASDQAIFTGKRA